jgi:hypothetical protein
MVADFRATQAAEKRWFSGGTFPATFLIGVMRAIGWQSFSLEKV